MNVMNTVDTSVENGMLSGPCRYCFEFTQNSDGICEDCSVDIKIAESLESENKRENEND